MLSNKARVIAERIEKRLKGQEWVPASDGIAAAAILRELADAVEFYIDEVDYLVRGEV